MHQALKNAILCERISSSLERDLSGLILQLKKITACFPDRLLVLASFALLLVSIREQSSIRDRNIPEDRTQDGEGARWHPWARLIKLPTYRID